MNDTQNFKYARLSAPKHDTWRICWYNIHPASNELKRVRKTFNLNRIEVTAIRRATAQRYVALINEALRKGYNYWVHTEGIKDENKAGLLSVGKMIENITKSRVIGLAKRTVDSYESYTNVFTAWLRETGIYDKPAISFTALDYMAFIQYKSSKGHGNRNINDFTIFYKTSFQIACDLDFIDKNPLKKIKTLPQNESTRFEAITPDQLQQIAAALQQHSMHYYAYTKFTSHEYIRPYHTARLKAKDIWFDKDLIAINDTTSKNKKVKYKQLLPEVKKLLIALEYHKLPGDWYIFGKDFKPSPTLYPSLSNRSAELWKKLIIDGLGIDKKMYALKHTSGEYYINENENVDAAWLQAHMEHSTLAETQAYIGKRKVKKIDTKNVKMINY